MKRLHRLLVPLVVAFFVTSASSGRAADSTRDAVAVTVNAAVEPIMATYRIPGMAVGVIADGKPYVFNYGVASARTRQPIADDTLFELGSVSKTLTATLAAYAAVTAHLSLRAPAGDEFPALRGSAFGNLSLIELATHTSGGLPLQVPDDIHDNAALIRYLRRWQPRYSPGTYRTYSNISIGMLGLISARYLGKPFDVLMERDLFPALGMRHTYVRVPAAEMARYAEGYRRGVAIRMAPNVLSEEAYGIRTTAADMLRFIQANMNEISLDPPLANAIAQTHAGYFQDGVLTQDLIWEQLRYPVTLNALLAGNAATMILDATPVSKIDPPQAPRADVWIDKTGSTNGFGAYVAFVPQERFGIVLLANEDFPIRERVTIAYTVLRALRRVHAEP